MHYKKLILILVLFYTTSNKCKAQNSIAYTYDKGGNMIQRNILIEAGMRLGNFNSAKDSLPPKLAFKLYPNPTNQYVNLEGELPAGVKEAQLRLMNLSGQVLKTDSYKGQLKSLPVNDLNDGLYLLEIAYSKKDKATYKIIITH